MTTIRLYNTKTRKKDTFVPLDPKNVRMYVCGPTVYDRAHLGNARPVLVFDVLFRLLRHVYGEGAVTYVRNVTDVDDKINARAAESGRPIRAITEETLGWFHDDMAALGALPPSHEPRATEFIGQMVAMIAGLIARGHAYAAEGHVLFAVDSYKDYGRLSGRTVEDMIAGARVEVAPYKKNPMDFVLWKPSSDELPGWPSPWGRGRPGWHIECSAMADEILMKGLSESKKSFDIHGGGIDLQFPHHENEIAQSMCTHPKGEFARIWMHNEMLQVEGKKMSKSLGNFFTVRDLLDGNWSGGWKVPGEVIRFVMLSTHYRKPMDWTGEKAREAETTLTEWYSKAEHVDPDPQGIWAIVLHLANDLDTSHALKSLAELSEDPNRYPELRFAMEWFGFGFPERVAPRAFRQETHDERVGSQIVSTSYPASLPLELRKLLGAKAHELSKLREMARDNNDYTAQDGLRNALEAAGLKVNFGKGSVALVVGPGFDRSKLEALK